MLICAPMSLLEYIKTYLMILFIIITIMLFFEIFKYYRLKNKYYNKRL